MLAKQYSCENAPCNEGMHLLEFFVVLLLKIGFIGSVELDKHT